MKSLAILSEASKLVYAWFDDEFKEKLAQVDDLAYESHSCKTTNLSYCAEKLFLPIATSYFLLSMQTNENYICIECENVEFIVCFQKLEQHLYIGMDQKTVSCKDQLFREIGFLRSIISFLFGLSGHSQLLTHNTAKKEQAWHIISLFLVSYIESYQTENTFLLEGIENLQISDSVANTCSKLYKISLNSCIDSVVKKQMQYVLIFWGTKLLWIKKHSNKSYNLTTKNLLLILALVQSDINSNVLTHDTFLNKERPPSVTHCGHLQSDFDYLNDNLSQITFASSSRVVLGTLPSVSESDHFGNESTDESICDSPFQTKEKKKVHFWFDAVQPKPHNNKLYTLPVFLSNMKTACKPSQICCIQLSNLVKLVILFEVPHYRFSSICCVMVFLCRSLGQIVNETSSNFKKKMNVLEQRLDYCIKLFCEYGKKLGNDFGKVIHEISILWNNSGKPYIKTVAQSNTEVNVNNLKYFVAEVDDKLCMIFKKLHPPCIDANNEFLSKINLTRIEMKAKQELQCFVDYRHLHMKSKQDITIFLNDFPGMVHFAYVKRTKMYDIKETQPDLIVVPSLDSASCLDKVGKVFFLSLQKEFARFLFLTNSHCLMNRKSCFAKSHNGFAFTSSVVICSTVENALQKLDVDQCLDAAFNPKNKPCFFSPSLFCGNFYDELLPSTSVIVESDVYDHIVFQLITVHFECIPNSVIVKHRKLLLQKLFHIQAI